MKLLKRNQRKFHYANVKIVESLTDEQGYSSGEHKIVYDTPVEASGSFVSPNGEYVRNVFGAFRDYDEVLIIDDLDCAINEDSVLFVHCEPKFKDGIPANDYIVRKVIPRLNFLFVAIGTLGA